MWIIQTATLVQINGIETRTHPIPQLGALAKVGVFIYRDDNSNRSTLLTDLDFLI